MRAVEASTLLFIEALEKLINTVLGRYENKNGLMPAGNDTPKKPIKLIIPHFSTLMTVSIEAFCVYGYIYEPYAMKPALKDKFDKITSRVPGEVHMMDLFNALSQMSIKKKYPNHLF